ncbi:multiple banded antigen [Penaeus vannamei]|uniref:Multiple banded antigen n=1 Tax=Penaeus vannamei TaxID=6689 RepID=A0A3R7PD03_PENVA|nr:multiple banded antigen [Penaeus vannamei]
MASFETRVKIAASCLATYMLLAILSHAPSPSLSPSHPPKTSRIREGHFSRFEDEEEEKSLATTRGRRHRGAGSTTVSEKASSPERRECRALFTVAKRGQHWADDGPYASLARKLPSLMTRSEGTGETTFFRGTRLDLMGGEVPYVPCKIRQYDPHDLGTCSRARSSRGQSTWVAFVGDSNCRQKVHSILSFLPQDLEYTFFLGDMQVSREDFIVTMYYHNHRPLTFDIFGRRRGPQGGGREASEGAKDPAGGIPNLTPHTPSSGETQKPSSGETQKPSSGETQKPSSGDTQTPSSGETQKPSSGETQTPFSGETQTPSSGEAQKPSTGETQKPSGEPQKLSSGEPQKPSSGETQKPSSGETRTDDIFRAFEFSGKTHVDFSIFGLHDSEVPLESYDLRVTLVWAPLASQVMPPTAKERIEVARLKEWAEQEVIPDIIVFGLGKWFLLEKEDVNELVPYTDAHHLLGPLVAPLARLAARTRVLWWHQSRYRWFNFETEDHTPWETEVRKYWEQVLSMNQFRDGIPFMDNWLWRTSLRDTGMWQWDSTVPFNIANLKECLDLRKAGEVDAKHYTGKWWNCRDAHHSSYETNADEIQMLLNLLCNPYIASREQYCCSEG